LIAPGAGLSQVLERGEELGGGPLEDGVADVGRKLAEGLEDELALVHQRMRDGERGRVDLEVAGAGGGGFLLLIVPRERQNSVFEALHPYRELPFMVEESGSKVIFDDRSYSSK